MLFVSTSGALGRYVNLPVPVTIGVRAVIAVVLLFLFCKWKKISLRVPKKDLGAVLVSGVLLGLHWITYFYALRLSNVAIGMISLFTYPILTAFLEPLLLKTKFQKIHLVLALLVLAGIYFLVPSFDVGNDYTLAVGVGTLSALFYSLRNLLLKAKAAKYNGSMLMCYQLLVISVLLSSFYSTVQLDVVLSEWKGLAVLALLTTAIGHTLFLNSFKNFSITTVSILSSVQPIYGILLGAIFLSEFPKINTLIGGVLILSSVVIESIRSSKKA
ncbi:DMT family transporter [Cellulophaga baltica]|uniref:Threonine/homoserine efflux transporter RhtA n=1 Tax=Cellulophaga baltica TaxID=76594 RepID=A0A1G7J3W1_9FLAO|nr:DMT family transporter [Cellulophaga baltica]SDF19610.1 Threonine/homoserine efflux transporter RhtA [Cellulophaga baltica]